MTRQQEREACLDEIRGCLFGGAAGDALGYPVEFLNLQGFMSDYGPNGITEYNVDKRSGKALISDDTQMTLFTANGFLVYEAQAKLRGIAASPSAYIAMAYRDWLTSQSRPYSGTQKGEQDPQRVSWLLDVPEMYSRRAPGLTCLSALAKPERVQVDDFINTPVNCSKGCGGVMRVAPLGAVPWEDIRELDMVAAQAAAITHSHPLGYLPAAVLCHVINRIIYPTQYPLDPEGIVLEAKETVCDLFKDTEHAETLAALIDLAVELSGNDEADTVNIRQLGAGWVGEEALAISLYCALRYRDNFSAGIIAAVNHDGDSDSTGAITGNILGALVGYTGIEDKWKENLELSHVILELADDLCRGCTPDTNWERKYGSCQFPV